jgi:enoyl-CoA hydratase/carnithine racemase
MLVIREDHGAIAVLTMNAPDRLNPLSDTMLSNLQDAFAALREDPDIRVIVLRGAGRAFCAGHDLREMQQKRAERDRGVKALKALFDRCARLMQTIPKLPQPVIAQVHGMATAAGCQLVASCDLAVAAEDTRFGVNGVNIGLFCSTPMVALSRNIGRKAAFEMLTTGRFISALEAREAGLVNRVVPADALEAETMALAGTVAEKLGSAVQIGKRAFYDQLEMPLRDAYAYTGNAMVENMLDEGTVEGIAAFLEKRRPAWQQ